MDLSYIYIQNIELDQNAVTIANNVSHFNAGELKARDAKNEFKKFAEQFPLHRRMSIGQIEYIAERQEKWAELVTKAYNDILLSAWVTTTDTKKYNSNTTGCFADNELLAYGEWHEQMARFLDVTQKALDELSYTAKKRLEKTA